MRPRYASDAEDVIQDLSALLNVYAHQRGVAGASTFRNPFGVSRKVNKFRAAEADQPPLTVRGAQLEPKVWAEFHGRPDALAAAAAALRAQIYSGEVEDDLAARAGLASRGPAPTFGSSRVERHDGECVVYVLRLTGGVEALFPGRSLVDHAMAKIGRSNAVGRRTIELNAGFPPTSAISWRVDAARPFSRAQDAHDFEHGLLRRLSRRGLSQGKEFALVPLTGLDHLLDEPGAP